ncbi:AI-2E family transporter [uncultured Methanospirillum sp.]|uniref:AI-2E family transporter n=1 Tax=uncultured Methanospirillum sp. TaxID=262503 RepID=UPI0029C9A821|nr:AI-2E family transporter [uncultured Methanospirillum sp.]
MAALRDFPQIDRFLFLGACCFIILTGLKMAGGFIGPLLISIFAAIIFSFVSLWFQKKGFSIRTSGYIAFTIFVACLVMVGAIIVLSISPLISHLPKISEGINSNIHILQGSLSQFGIDLGTILPVTQMTGSLSSFSPDAVYSVIGQFSTLFIVLFTTLFLLLEATSFSRKINSILGSQKQELADQINEFGSIVLDYVIIRTKVNLVTGAGFGIALVLLGVQDPLLWGVMMFVLNFVPYIGFLIAVIPPAVLALIDISPLTAGLVIIIASLVNLFSENILFPELAGRGMDLSPAVVFISMIFWGYFLGGSGVIVAIPLTVLLKMVLDSFPETQWAAQFIGPGPSEETQ